MPGSSVKTLVFREPLLPIVIIFYSLATLSTIFRLIYRARFRQLWWDDFWAFLALINIVLLFGAYIRAAFNLPPAWLSSFALVMVTSRLALWSSRLSVAVTIVRVIATGKARLISKAVAVLFGLLAIAVVVQRAVFCSPAGVNYLCRDKSIVTGYTDLATSFFSDIWLLAAPSYLLWKMKLKKRFYRLLQAIFLTEIMVLTMSILQWAYTVKSNVQAQGVLSHFKVTVSLIVCNLLFLVTYFYRMFRNGDERSEDSTTTAPSRKPTAAFSTPAESGTESKGASVQTQFTQFTGDMSDSNTSNDEPSRILYETEPGIVDRDWPSAGIPRPINSV